MRRNILLSLTILFVTTMIVSCDNDNKGYEEYYHPMGNNPVMVVSWLKKVKNSLVGTEAQISLYQWNDTKYYTAQSYYKKDNKLISPFTIYEANDDVEIVFFHTDNALASEQDPVYIDFVENADLIYLLWSNETKYSVIE